MQISLNGKPHAIENSTTLAQIIEEFSKNNKHIIAELNGTIIKSQTWQATAVKNGDQLELVSIVGGG